METKWFQKISYQEAEAIAGMRLDRRRQYYKHTYEGATVDNGYAFNGSCGGPSGKIFTYFEWSSCCSGCADDSEYSAPIRGGGCSECGYTGKRRDGMHTPVEIVRAQPPQQEVKPMIESAAGEE